MKSHPNWGKSGDIYVCEADRAASSVDMEVFENRGIKIPADPGIFTPVALQRIVDGKFERNTARKLPKLIKQGASYLEIGAGIGFLAAIIAKEIPSVSVTTHEESKPLLKTAVHILDLNKLETGPNFKQSNLPLFDTKDRTNSVEKLQQMIGESRCDVLVISDPRIDAGILADALSKVENRPKTVLISARALAGQMKASPVKKALEPLGFTSDTESPLSSALLMARKAT